MKALGIRIELPDERERALTTKAELDFKNEREQFWADLMASESYATHRKANIDRESEAGEFIKNTIDLHVRLLLWPLIEQRLRIELELRRTHHMPFPTSRIETLRSELRGLVHDKWPWLIRAVLHDTEEHLRLHGWMTTKEVEEAGHRLLGLPPEATSNIFERLEDLLKATWAEAVFFNNP